jgi:glycosyltransferase involved in cell wall biosynthesis
VQSPPLLVSYVAVFALWIKRKKIILNVSDLWPLAAIELKALKKDSFSHQLFLCFERFIYNKATLILGQSKEILQHVKLLVPQKKCFLYKNFPVHDNVKIIKPIDAKNDSVKIFYAGLLGVAQGIFELCKNLEIDHLNMEFHVLGDGPEKANILEYIEQNPNKKFFFYGMLNRKDLHDKIQEFDIAIVPLKTRIYGSVPSKIFEYGSLGFPILYFGGGEGETIVLENNMGWVATVGDYKELNEQLTKISAISKENIQTMRKGILEQSKKVFNLNSQMHNLLSEEVF